MRKHRPIVTSPDQVKITINGIYAEIDYFEPGIPGTRLEIGEKIKKMTDQEIIDIHNQCLESQNRMREEYDHNPVEIPVGKPQIRYFADGDQWVPRGDVLRCEISDGGEDYETTIMIDDKELTLKQFGRLLSTYNGWGMRITFVPDDRIHENPVIEVREPEEEN